MTHKYTKQDIITAQETMRWTPYWKQWRCIDDDLLLECIIIAASFWLNYPDKEDYAKNYIKWMTLFFMDDLKAKAEERMHNPLEAWDEISPEHERACQIIIEQYDAIFWSECMR